MEKSGLIKARFAELGLTQAKAAEKLGTTQQLVNAYINGVRKFGTQVAQKWSDAFGFSAAWLLTGEGFYLKDMGNGAINIGSISNSVKDDHSIRNSHIGTSTEVAELKAENAHLQEKVSHLEAMVAEKERLITVLMKNA